MPFKAEDKHAVLEIAADESPTATLRSTEVPIRKAIADL